MTELALPKIDKDTISRKDQIVSHLKKFTKDENVLSENEAVSYTHLTLPTKVYV